MIDLNISHDRFESIYNVLNEYFGMQKKKKKKKSKILMINKTLKTMLSYRLKCEKNTENKNPRVLKTKKRKNGLIKLCCLQWLKIKIY